MNVADGAVPLVKVTRRDVRTGREVVESVHHGHLVHVDEDGTVASALGDPDAVMFPRSALKPFQAIACLELIAAADPALAAALTGAEVAVGWASHRAEAAQLAAVRALLVRAGITEDALSCPTATAPDDPVAGPARITHNCSGKHALFALTARTLGLDAGLTPGSAEHRSALLAIDSPLQQQVLAVVTDLVGPAHAVGVDGCGAPALALPLSALAAAFARLAVDDRAARVRAAGSAHPWMVGGAERRDGAGVPLVDSALLAAGNAAGVIAKRGAEGVLAAGWRGEDGRGHGVVVKALDGSMRGAATAVVALLEAHGAVPANTWREPAPQGGGATAGTVRPAWDASAR